MDAWQPLGAVAPTALVEARLQLHWAAQAILAAADGLLRHADDDSHTNMRWLGRHRRPGRQRAGARTAGSRCGSSPSSSRWSVPTARPDPTTGSRSPAGPWRRAGLAVGRARAPAPRSPCAATTCRPTPPARAAAFAAPGPAHAELARGSATLPPARRGRRRRGGARPRRPHVLAPPLRRRQRPAARSRPVGRARPGRSASACRPATPLRRALPLPDAVADPRRRRPCRRWRPGAGTPPGFTGAILTGIRAVRRPRRPRSSTPSPAGSSTRTSRSPSELIGAREDLPA